MLLAGQPRSTPPATPTTSPATSPNISRRSESPPIVRETNFGLPIQPISMHEIVVARNLNAETGTHACVGAACLGGAVAAAVGAASSVVMPVVAGLSVLSGVLGLTGIHKCSTRKQY